MPPSCCWALPPEPHRRKPPRRPSSRNAQALAANPRDAEAYGRREAAYIKTKAYDKAPPDFTEALRLDAQNGTFFCGRGDCHRMLGMHELAVADYSAAIKYNDLHPHFFGMRGNCYMALGKR